MITIVIEVDAVDSFVAIAVCACRAVLLTYNLRTLIGSEGRHIDLN